MAVRWYGWTSDTRAVTPVILPITGDNDEISRTHCTSGANSTHPDGRGQHIFTVNNIPSTSAMTDYKCQGDTRAIRVVIAVMQNRSDSKSWKIIFWGAICTYLNGRGQTIFLPFDIPYGWAATWHGWISDTGAMTPVILPITGEYIVGCSIFMHRKCNKNAIKSAKSSKTAKNLCSNHLKRQNVKNRY